MIQRNPSEIEDTPYDVIIVGGGIYGTCLTLECVSRGLRPLLLEESDFGSGASANTLRIVHGGLRYLQTLDLRRFRRSVEQRRWWLQTFPSLVRPMPCVMPLYGRGLKRPSILRAALLLNDLLSSDRNRCLRDDRQIARGRVIGPLETRRLFPGCESKGLKGGALWYDASMVSAQRLIMELLRWACSAGASAANYVSARTLLTNGRAVAGVLARDEISGQEHSFTAPIVISAAGGGFSDAWSASEAADGIRPLERSLAFNVLLRCEPPASVAVAGTPTDPEGRTYFLRPMAGATLAGTFHAPWRPAPARRSPKAAAESMVSEFLSDLGRAFPGFSPSADEVVRVFPGLVPAEAPGSPEPAKHPRVLSHGAHGGPAGLFSVSGVKFTTAPGIASSVLDLITKGRLAPRAPSQIADARPPVRPLLDAMEGPVSAQQLTLMLEEERAMLQRMVREEAVVFAEDLVLRRLDLALLPFDLTPALAQARAMFPGLAGRSARPPES